MIKYADIGIELFIKWLNEEYAISQPVYIAILHGYDSVESNNGSGFAAYLPDKNKPIMMVAGDINAKMQEAGLSVEDQLKCIAHEYKHHIQFYSGKLDYSEENETEAEEFAKEIVEKYMNGD
jgi:hypothetical protein